MRKISRVSEDEVLSDCNRMLLLCCFPIASCAGSRDPDSAPWNASVLPADSPSRSPCAHVIRVGICLADLIGCNRSDYLHIFINIHILVFFCSVSGSTCVFCVDRPFPRVLLCPYVSERLSLTPPFSHLLFGPRPRWSRLVLHAHA